MVLDSQFVSACDMETSVKAELKRLPAEVLKCKVADGGAGDCKLVGLDLLKIATEWLNCGFQIEYAQKKGRPTPITTHSATVTLTSATVQATPLTKISPAAKAEINKAKKANEL